MAVGVLTAGGDCPGLNAAIRAVVARVTGDRSEVVGIANGWRGLMEGLVRPMGRDDVRGIVSRGGTILGTSRLDPYVHGDGYASVASVVESSSIDSLVVLGGDGSLRTATRLYRDGGLPVVGIPKTIDNDIGGTDVALGFYTAVQIVVDALDRLTTTAEAHNRVMVVEVMGRTAGWIAAASAMGGGAEAVVVPEAPTDYQALAQRLKQRHSEGHDYSVVVVAEGAPDPLGKVSTAGLDSFGFERLGGVGERVAHELEGLTGFECRVTTLGHLQRGGTPAAYDRILGTRFGIKAAELALEGSTGQMVAVHGERIVPVDIDEACKTPRPLDPAWLKDARWLLA